MRLINFPKIVSEDGKSVKCVSCGYVCVCFSDGGDSDFHSGQDMMMSNNKSSSPLSIPICWNDLVLFFSVISGHARARTHTHTHISNIIEHICSVWKSVGHYCQWVSFSLRMKSVFTHIQITFFAQSSVKCENDECRNICQKWAQIECQKVVKCAIICRSLNKKTTTTNSDNYLHSSQNVFDF